MTVNKKRTKEEIKEVVEQIGYKFLNDYRGGKRGIQMVIIQDSNGYKYDVYLGHLISGHVPNFADKRNPFTLSHNIPLWLKKNNKPFVLWKNNTYNGALEKIFFKCLEKSCGEVFDATWGHVYSNGCGCSFCDGKRVGKYNNLEYLQPEISKEWDYIKNDKTPDKYAQFSSQRVWWKCSKCEYSWRAVISSRSHGSGCPSCFGKIVSDKNRLSLFFPKLVSEWHPIKNGILTCNEVSYGSDKEVWWICSRCNGEWKSSVCNRSAGNGCPRCADSLNESVRANELKRYFKENYSGKDEHRVLKNPETNRWLPYDIYIPHGENPDINGFYIEVHGEQHYKICTWHKSLATKNNTTPKEEFEYQKYKDKLKRKFAKKNGTYIEIDLRKIKTTEQAIELIEKIIGKTYG